MKKHYSHQKGHKNNFRHKKELGQNFIEDETLLDQLIILAEIAPEDQILEIGAGEGSLTKKLIQKAAKVLSVEIDPRLIPLLRLEEEKHSTLKIVEGDILKKDLSELL